MVWKFRFAALALTAAALWLAFGHGTFVVARGLVCRSSDGATDAILIENFDPEYVLFEHARRLREAGVSPRVLVPLPLDGAEPNAVALAITDAMARLARLGTFEIVPLRLSEPISLNAARDVRDFLRKHYIRSVTVVSPLFRSRRSALVYSATLEPVGIRVRCEAVGSAHDIRTWTKTWHGIQGVTEQWLKLQYYRFYVLPFRT